MPNAAPRTGNDALPVPDESVVRPRFTYPFNFSNSPTLTLPCGFTADGVPIALQLAGPHFSEATLLRALEISRNSLGTTHPVVVSILHQYAGLLKKMKRKDEAREIKEQAREAARVHVRDNPNYQMVDVSSLVSR